MIYTNIYTYIHHITGGHCDACRKPILRVPLKNIVMRTTQAAQFSVAVSLI